MLAIRKEDFYIFSSHDKQQEWQPTTSDMSIPTDLISKLAHTSRLLSLLLELRLHIYELIITKNVDVWFSHERKPSKPVTGINLLFVNRQINAEATPFLFENTIFSWDERKRLRPSQPLGSYIGLLEDLPTESHAPITNIKHIYVVVNGHWGVEIMFQIASQNLPRPESLELQADDNWLTWQDILPCIAAFAAPKLAVSIITHSWAFETPDHWPIHYLSDPEPDFQKPPSSLRTIKIFENVTRQELADIKKLMRRGFGSVLKREGPTLRSI